MLWMFMVLLVIIIATGIVGQLFLRLRSLRAHQGATMVSGPATRYRPMERLLSEADDNMVAGNSALRRKFRAERRKLFRRYLKCLTRDYGCLLNGIRLTMVQSGIDRPDLLRAVARNRIYFALAICRIEYRLALHAAGLGTVDISGVVTAFETLREQMAAFAAVPAGAGA